MEEKISKYALDIRADKANERRYHYIAQQIQQEDARERDLRKEDLAELDHVDEEMKGEDVDHVVNAETLTDAPSSKTGIICHLSGEAAGTIDRYRPPRRRS